MFTDFMYSCDTMVPANSAVHRRLHQKTEASSVPGIHRTAAIGAVRNHEVISDASKVLVNSAMTLYCGQQKTRWMPSVRTMQYVLERKKLKKHTFKYV